MSKAIAIILATFLTGAYALIIGSIRSYPEPQPPKPEPTPTWLRINKESMNDVPDSPEQVCVVITTSDGSKWVAVWQETHRRRN